jgi:xanthine dehydrogenase YagS FAD-binding subunit
VTLGTLTTLAEIGTHPIIQRRYLLLAQAAAVAATPQQRNMATLGGNLLQRPRCWYFRNRLFHC